MRPILAEIHTLDQHFTHLAAHLTQYRPNNCPTCGKQGLWHHGHYSRKADRESAHGNSLNPVSIPRFFCPYCSHTCSVLPECIPPRRWYLWEAQESAMQLSFSKSSFRAISKCIKPSRWTIRRWMQRFKDQFKRHAFHLKQKFQWLGYFEYIDDFWQAWLAKLRLSTAMAFLNQANVTIP